MVLMSGPFPAMVLMQPRHHVTCQLAHMLQAHCASACKAQVLCLASQLASDTEVDHSGLAAVQAIAGLFAL